MSEDYEDVEFEDEDDEIAKIETAAIVHGTDWTTETIVSQMRRKNISLNPQFQRRDAWDRQRKSRLIESLIAGLPVPQIVLAEAKEDHSKFLVLDGKQRLLSILQFWGEATDSPNNSFSLSPLELKPELSGKTFINLSTDGDLASSFNALCNQTIRTVVIRNWKDTDLLHTIFLRLNTGNVKLSPQELRQALLPGPFTTYVDSKAAESPALRRLLSLSHPDPRMRDVEILARYLSFRSFGDSYPGRMKTFLDGTFNRLNKNWSSNQTQVEQGVEDFEAGVLDLLNIFDGRPARKPQSPQFNRAIFDALIYFQSDAQVRKASKGKVSRIKKAYESLFVPESKFLQAIESDTASAQNTYTRLQLWAKKLSTVTDLPLKAPAQPKTSPSGKRSRQRGKGKS